MKTTSLFRSSDSSPHSTAAFVRSVVFTNLKPRLWLAAAAPAQVIRTINNQGRVAVNGVNFEGSGRFRLAVGDGWGRERAVHLLPRVTLTRRCGWAMR